MSFPFKVLININSEKSGYFDRIIIGRRISSLARTKTNFYNRYLESRI